MKSFMQLGLAFVLCFLPAAASAVEAVRPKQEDMLIRAVYSENRLWLLSDAGQLFSLTQTDTLARQEGLIEPAYDMCASNGQLTLLTLEKSKNIWNLRPHTAQGWGAALPIAMQNEAFVALVCESGDPVVVTTRRLLTLSNNEIKSVALKVALKEGEALGIASTLATDTSIYIGLNRGEWGGGLRKIDRITGEITPVSHVDGTLCGGLLNAACDPVNGLATLPWGKNCIAAAIGLAHLSSHGRIISICKDQIEEIYKKQYSDLYDKKNLSLLDTGSTIPFFGLLSSGDQLVAIGSNGLYHLGANGKATFKPMPAFKKVGPFHVNFSTPGIILVLTSINQRTSVSGPTPMMIAK